MRRHSPVGTPDPHCLSGLSEAIWSLRDENEMQDTELILQHTPDSKIFVQS
jgi:hypothetical protein